MEDKRSEASRCDTCRWYDGWYDWGQCLWWFLNDPMENHPMPVSGGDCCGHWEPDGINNPALRSEDRTYGRNP